MIDNALFSVSEFAMYSRTTRDTILHYDRIGLLTPVTRGENNYRFYSGEQLITVYVIRSLQKLGMSLDEIKDISDKATPEQVNEVFEQQIVLIEGKIHEWVRARKLLRTLREIIQSVADIDENEITIQYVPAQAIILGGLNDYSRDRSYLDAYVSFYHDMNEIYPDLDLHYPVWSMYSKAQVQHDKYNEPDRFYFYNPEGHDKKPGAIYAIGYARGGRKQINKLFGRLKAYINDNGFEICGNAYEERPLKQALVGDYNNYLVRVMIIVKEKAKL